jgi:hypothetical protein
MYWEGAKVKYFTMGSIALACLSWEDGLNAAGTGRHHPSREKGTD